MHPWQITAWLNRERLTLEQGAYRFGVSTGTLLKWRDTCHVFSPRQAQAITAVMGFVPEMPREQPVLWNTPCPGKGKPGVLTGEQVRARRESMGYTGAELARVLGLSPQYLSDVERNRRRCTDRIALTLATLERKLLPEAPGDA